MRQVTCMDCLEVMKDAVYCQRCSHTGCRRCLDVDDSGMCKDCMCATLPRGGFLSTSMASDNMTSVFANTAQGRGEACRGLDDFADGLASASYRCVRGFALRVSPLF